MVLIKGPKDAAFAQIREGVKLKNKDECDKREKEKLKKVENENKEQNGVVDLGEALQKRYNAMCGSDTDHSSSDSNSGNWAEDEKVEQEEEEQTKHTNLPSGREERSESPDSGCGDDVGSRATSPLHPEQKTEESLAPPSSCIDSPSAAQVNNVDPVDNEVQDSSTLPFKERIKLLNSQRGGSVFPS